MLAEGSDARIGDQFDSAGGYQHHRGSVVAEHVIRQHPHCSILLAKPPDSLRW